MDNPFKSKNGFKSLWTQIWWGTLLTHWEYDKRVRRGRDASKGATVIFCRLGGGEEDALLAPRVPLLDLDIFMCAVSPYRVNLAATQTVLSVGLKNFLNEKKQQYARLIL